MTVIAAFNIVNGQYPYNLDRHDGSNFTISVPYTASNKSTATLYYQLTSSNSDYILTLGSFSLSAGASVSSRFVLSRTNPGIDVDESTVLTMNVYSNVTRTVLVSSQTVTLYYSIQDLESWGYQSIQDFSLGATNWTGQTGTTALVSATGTASLYYTVNPGSGGGLTISELYTRSNLVVPEYDKVVLSFYTLGAGNSSIFNYSASVTEFGLSFYVDDVLISSEQTDSNGYISVTATSNTLTYQSNWLRHTLDLTAFAGQTITLKIRYYQYGYSQYADTIFRQHIDGFRISAKN